MGDTDRFLAEAFLSHQIHLLRLSAGYEKKVLALLKQMEAELIDKLTGPRPLTAYSRERITNLINETRTIIAQVYIAIRDEVPLGEIAQTEVAFTEKRMATAIGVATDVAVPSRSVINALVSDLLIQGAPSAEWWRRQSGDTAFRFANAIRQGIAQGETNEQIIARVRGRRDMPGILEVSRRNADALVRSSVQTVANASRMAMFEENADILRGVRQLSTLDSRTSDICVAYSGGEWSLPDYRPINGTKLPFNGGPPRHWNCRSVLTPIVRPLPGLPEFMPGERAAEGGPVRGDITFNDWLKDKPKAYQDDLLGKGKAELWRQGKITLPQLLDQSGRPLSLEELRERYT